MTDAELLTKIKTGLFGTDNGTWRDDMIQVFIDEVKAFMRDAGVPEDVVKSESSVGCIMMGVSDLWNYSSGDVKFSQYFQQRVIQLSAKSGGEAT